MKGSLSIHRLVTALIFKGLRGDIIETLGTKEKSLVRAMDPFCNPDSITEIGIVVMRGEVVIQGSALRIEAV